MGRASTETAAPSSERVPAGTEPSDDALVAAVRTGDDRAFERLFSRYQRRISAFVHRLVPDHGRAEDVTQEVFLSALRRLRQTDRPVAFKPWIYEIARNAAIDEFRRTQRTKEVFVDIPGEIGDEPAGAISASRSAPPPDVAAGHKQALRDLCGAFGGLSDSHHEVLVLRELEGLSYREIGERLGLSQAAVESTLFRARRRLSEEYAQLASGERCADTQSMMGPATNGALEARDLRRFAEHVSHCTVCRRQARAAGVSPAVLDRPERRRRRSLGEKIGALLPFPAFWRKSRGEGGSEASAAVSPATSRASEVMAQLSAAAPVAEPLATGWGKAAAAAATLVLAGVGAGVGSQVGGTAPEKPPEPLVARVNDDPAPSRAAARTGGLGAASPSSGAGDPRAGKVAGSRPGAGAAAPAALSGAAVIPALSPGAGAASPSLTGRVNPLAPALPGVLPGSPERVVEPGGRPQAPDTRLPGTAPTVPPRVVGIEPPRRPADTDAQDVPAPVRGPETVAGGRAPAEVDVAPPAEPGRGPELPELPPAAAPGRDGPVVPEAPGQPTVPPPTETPTTPPVIDTPAPPVVGVPSPPPVPEVETPPVATPPVVTPPIETPPVATPDLPATPSVPEPPAVQVPDSPLGAG